MCALDHFDIDPLCIRYTLTGYIGLGFYFYDSKDAWRAPYALTMIPPIILCAGIYWMPESPRYLLLKGRNEEAWAIITRLHSDPSDPQDEFAKREYYQMHRQIEFDATMRPGYKEMFTRPSYRKRVFITVTLLVCVMSSGVLVIQSKTLRPFPNNASLIAQINQIMALFSTVPWAMVQWNSFSCKQDTQQQLL